ncbi:MAG: phosphoserine phosphatase [Bacteroidia bacterium]|nr:MAG: phosphoserine phosphatase [Bacteroidia bacterium]
MQHAKTPTVALVYDFDGTLSPKNMQEYDYLKAIGVASSEDFWDKCARMVQQYNASNILCYMKLMLDKARAEGVSLKREQFRAFGASVELYPGVLEWFGHINSLGQELGLRIEHYINSSGLAEMIEGTPIAQHFRQIYACSFMYIDGVAQWPAVAVDFTTKTQFLFMINKGIERVSENRRVNDYLAEAHRPVPFKHMIYFGDGETDIPCMRLVKQQGGNSIAVYAPGNHAKQQAARGLMRDDRVNFASPADYSQNGQLYCIVHAILQKIKFGHEFDTLQRENRQEYS